MEILNLIGSVCSILSLLIAIFLASQVIKIKNQIKDNSENIVKQKRINTGGGDIAGRDIK